MRKIIIRTSSSENGSLFSDRFFVCFLAVFVSALVVGAIFSGFYSQNTDSVLYAICKQNLDFVGESSVFSIFLYNFLSCLVYLILIYSFGMCSVGTAFLYMIAFIFGIGKGIFIGFLYPSENFSGIIGKIVSFVPQNILLCSTIIFALNFAAKMSVQNFKTTAQIDMGSSQYISFKRYNQRFLLYSSLIIVYCLFDAIIMKFYL